VNLEKEKTTYIVYAQGHGFGTGATSSSARFVSDWTKARPFTYTHHASSMIARLSKVYKIPIENILCIPVVTKLDPQEMFAIVLTGKTK
jgi:hypothetical protein